MSKDLKRIQQHARELARSGKFVGSRAVAFELQLSPGTRKHSNGFAIRDARRVRSPLCEARMRISRKDQKQPDLAHGFAWQQRRQLFGFAGDAPRLVHRQHHCNVSGQGRQPSPGV